MYLEHLGTLGKLGLGLPNNGQGFTESCPNYATLYVALNVLLNSKGHLMVETYML